MLKLGAVAPDGKLTTVQLYVRLDSPVSSAPRTLSVVLVPAIGSSAALAGTATLGGVLMGL